MIIVVTSVLGTGTDSELLSKSSPVTSSRESKKSKDSKDKKNNKNEDNKNKDEAEDLQSYKCNASAFLQDVVNSNEE